MKKRIAVDPGFSKELIEDTLKGYPEKTAKERSKHLAVNDPSGRNKVKSNVKTRPGVLSSRGCTWAGCKGVIVNQIKGMIPICHGAVGCGHYSWDTRRNYATGKRGLTSFTRFHVTTFYQDRDIVFGGDKKLAKAIDELNDMFPLAQGMDILSECPVGLIGDDIQAVARKKAKDIDKIVVPYNCEGFRGVSQSLGHHIANDMFRDWVVDKYEPQEFDPDYKPGPYDVTYMGDYNVGGDAWEVLKILKTIGLNVTSRIVGDPNVWDWPKAKYAKLTIVHCARSMQYLAKHLEKKYGVPYYEANFIGASNVFESLRGIANYFDDRIKENVESFIKKWTPYVEDVRAEYKPRLEGKKIMLFVGGLRPRHVAEALQKDFDMVVVGTGYEFAHDDDYEKTYPKIGEGAIIYDDITLHEFDRFAKALKPDLIGAGIKEKYAFHKMGIPFRQMHSWDYSGPYHGILGFKRLARDMDMAINGGPWKYVKAPWKKGGNDEKQERV